MGVVTQSENAESGSMTELLWGKYSYVIVAYCKRVTVFQDLRETFQNIFSKKFEKIYIF